MHEHHPISERLTFVKQLMTGNFMSKYAITGKYGTRPTEILDYADSMPELTQLLTEYRMAFGKAWYITYKEISNNGFCKKNIDIKERITDDY